MVTDRVDRRAPAERVAAEPHAESLPRTPRGSIDYSTFVCLFVCVCVRVLWRFHDELIIKCR